MSRNPCQTESSWYGLYPTGSSKDTFLFTEESTAHPAKMSLPLLARILEEMQAFGWLRTGDCVIDPFGGRGTTAAYWCGLHAENRAVTVEIEPHFVQMQEVNRAHAARKLGRPLQWEIIAGDSRRTDELLREGAAAAVLSPPYGKGTIGSGSIDPEKLIERCPSLKGRDPNGAWFKAIAAGYVNSPGNIDNCPDAAVLSPPYEGSLASDDPDKRGGLFRDPKRRGDRTLTGTYHAVTSPPYEGDQPCQSQSRVLKEHGYEGFKRGNHKRDTRLSSNVAGVTSPPYEDSINDRNGVDVSKCTKAGKTSQARLKGYQTPPVATVTSPPYEAQSGGSGPASRKSQPDPGVQDRCGYKTDSNGTAQGQIGATQGETYADACLAVYSSLARAGVRYLVTVTKNPTRNGKLRRLDKLTARLLRQAGYRVVAWRRAWLWHTEAQMEALGRHTPSLFEELDTPDRPMGRISFFKRIQLAKGGVAAQWEDVFLCELAGRR